MPSVTGTPVPLMVIEAEILSVPGLGMSSQDCANTEGAVAESNTSISTGMKVPERLLVD